MLEKQGATYTYALQKGADKKELPLLETGMKNLFQKSKELFPDMMDLPGFGAAGGTCFGLHTFLNAVIISGTDFLFQLYDLDTLLKQQ